MRQHVFVLFTLAFVVVCVPSFAADPAELALAGPYEVGFTSFVLSDSSRPGDGAAFADRPIPVYVWYPVDPGNIDSSTPQAVYPLDPLYYTFLTATSENWEAYGIDRAYQEPDPSTGGPFPLVMFSPGWGAAAWMHTSVGTRLASHGFVVAVVYHFGDQFWPWEPDFDHLAVASWNRPRDVSFALTDLLSRNATSGNLFHGLVMPEAVAAAGWSLGGYASMVLTAGDESVCDKFYELGMGPLPDWLCGPSPPDPRIKAIVPLDGSNQLLYFTELARVRIPAMGMGQEWGQLALDPEWASWQARQHAAFSGHPAYRIDVFNTIHQSFSDLCEGVQVLGDVGLFTPDDVAWYLANLCDGYTPSAEVHTLVGQYMVAFLDKTLLGNNRYKRLLTPGYSLTRQPLIEFFVTEKRSPQSIDEDWPDDFIYFMHQPGSDTAHAAKNPNGVLGLSRALEPLQ